ncbi:MAG: Nif11-like leader peptide family natural product precursor [Desmonostoc vinosum HA7617-LM4]|jgi:predicted ribosomally synthesized peptide with nif11-like leader|nr:Nif11-like leader peptide family natural product precursor [Desmonostoc vinosum HA7617-LM4]
MSLENVRAFYERLVNDEAFRTQVQSVTNPHEGSQIVKEAGYDFTQEEFEEYTTQILESNAGEGELRDVDEAELETVVGGATAALAGIFPRLILIYGAPSGLWKFLL